MAKFNPYEHVRNTPEYREWLARRVERHGTVLLPERYTFGSREDGSSRAPVSDGTDRRVFAHYTNPNYGRAQGNEWNERNYPTSQAPKRKRHTAKSNGATTEVWIPETDLQRHASILGNNNHNNH